MKILAVDTSCDESCVAIFDTENWKLLADVVHTHIKSMAQFGGIVPEIASRQHLKALPVTVQEALNRAHLKLEQIDWFVVTNRPGLIGALLVGVTFVKALAYANDKPYSVLDHMEAHLYSPYLITAEAKRAPEFPWVALVVSGGHTELFYVKECLNHQWLGGTLDDAAGEAFDKIGKLAGLEYPAGPAIDRLCRERHKSHPSESFEFPRAQLEGFSFSFSGLKTAVSLKLADQKLSDEPKETVAILSAAQEAILDSLVTKVTLAETKYQPKNTVVTGGVACNQRLREKLSHAYFPPVRHCTDNAAMVAILAAIYHRDGKLNPAPWETSAQTTSTVIGD